MVGLHKYCLLRYIYSNLKVNSSDIHHILAHFDQPAVVANLTLEDVAKNGTYTLPAHVSDGECDLDCNLAEVLDLRRLDIEDALRDGVRGRTRTVSSEQQNCAGEHRELAIDGVLAG